MTPIELACEHVDAAVFSGPHMDDPAEREMLRGYIERWQRFLAPFDAIEVAGLSTQKASELVVAPMIEALQHAVEGECDGLAISEDQAVKILGYLSAHATSPEQAARIGAAAPVITIENKGPDVQVDVTDVDGMKTLKIGAPEATGSPVHIRLMAAAALRTINTATYPREDIDLEAVASVCRHVVGIENPREDR